MLGITYIANLKTKEENSINSFNLIDQWCYEINIFALKSEICVILSTCIFLALF